MTVSKHLLRVPFTCNTLPETAKTQRNQAEGKSVAETERRKSRSWTAFGQNRLRRRIPLSIYAVLIIALLLIVLSQSMQASAGAIDISPAVARSGLDPSASTVLVTRLSDGQMWVSNVRRTSDRFSPASTSKIPHTLIALETGTVGQDTVFDWDGQRRWLDAWNQDHTLQTAFRDSAVWVFQEIVTRIGSPDMADWLDRLGYGNADIGSEAHLTSYWLDGTLQISAQEQIGFLSRLVQRQLPLSPNTYSAAENIMLSKAGEGWSLYGKTGWRHSKDIMDIGWYVGWLRCADDHYVFALNMDMPDASQRHLRKSSMIAVLTDLGAFECARSGQVNLFAPVVSAVKD
ncbi:MAG: penicillin-binding transpeptidase domain-containing protein [Pseudomonadota bacterium]